MTDITLEQLQQQAEADDAEVLMQQAYFFIKESKPAQAFEYVLNAANLGCKKAKLAIILVYLNSLNNEKVSDFIHNWMSDVLFLVIDYDLDYGKRRVSYWGCFSNDSNWTTLVFNLIASKKINPEKNIFDSFLFELNISQEELIPEFKYWLGVCYYMGLGVNKNTEKSYELFYEAAESGLARAQYQVANCMLGGIGTETNIDNAITWLQLSAEHGVEVAQYELSCLYFKGYGVEKNDKAGFSWLLKSAEQGLEAAQCDIANCYDKGIGVEKDSAEAFIWHIKSAEKGFVESQYWVARYYFDHGVFEELSDIDQKILKQDSRFRDIYADKGFEKSFYWAKQADNNRHIESNLLLGFMYEYGLGVLKDRDEAAECFEKALECSINGVAEFFLADYWVQGLFNESHGNRFQYYRSLSDPYKVKEYYNIDNLIENAPESVRSSIKDLKINLLIALENFDLARKGDEGGRNKKYIDICEQLSEQNRETKRLNDLLKKKELELEQTMSMFAHKFRSPLDAILYNTNHEHQPKLYIQAAQTMRGLLDIFSLISTDADKLQDRLKQDRQGEGNLVSVFGKTLDMVLLHLLSPSAKGIIRQHYLRYAKAHGLCDAGVSSKQWYEDYRELERQLQQDWEQAYAQLLGQSATLEQRLTWLEPRFFKLELLGFERADIQFEEYAKTESLLTIVLNEFLVNTFKFYASVENSPVVLEWTSRDRHQMLICRNPSTRHERTQNKGSGKGHIFLSALARKIGSEFVKPIPADDFVVEFSLADELLISNLDDKQ